MSDSTALAGVRPGERMRSANPLQRRARGRAPRASLPGTGPRWTRRVVPAARTAVVRGCATLHPQPLPRRTDLHGRVHSVAALAADKLPGPAAQAVVPGASLSLNAGRTIISGPGLVKRCSVGLGQALSERCARRGRLQARRAASPEAEVKNLGQEWQTVRKAQEPLLSERDNPGFGAAETVP